VSSFTLKPRAFIFLQNGFKSFCKVGSPQQMDTPESKPFLVSKNLKKSSSLIKSFKTSFIFSGSTNSGL
jgi:hypothetical protein